MNDGIAEHNSKRRPTGREPSEIRSRMVDEYGGEIICPSEQRDSPLTTKEGLAMFSDSDPSQRDTSCEIEFQSYFYQTPSLPAADPRSERPRCGGRESDFLAASRRRISSARSSAR